MPKYANPGTGICSQIEKEKGRGRRVTGSAPCMALPGLARRPATLPAAARAPPAPSRAHTAAHAPGPATRPPSGREPGAGDAARPDSGRSWDRCRALALRAAQAEESPGAQCLPGIGVGSQAGEAAGAGEKGLAGGGNPSFAEHQRRSGGDWALPPPVQHRVERRRVRLSSTPTAMCSSGVPPTPPRPAWPSHGLRPGDPLFLLVNTLTPPEKYTFPQPDSPAGDAGFTAPTRPLRRESSHAKPV